MRLDISSTPDFRVTHKLVLDLVFLGVLYHAIALVVNVIRDQHKAPRQRFVAALRNGGHLRLLKTIEGTTFN